MVVCYSVCVSSHFRRSNRGEGGKQGGGTNGVGDSVSEANKYVSEGSKCPAPQGGGLL